MVDVAWPAPPGALVVAAVAVDAAEPRLPAELAVAPAVRLRRAVVPLAERPLPDAAADPLAAVAELRRPVAEWDQRPLLDAAAVGVQPGEAQQPLARSERDGAGRPPWLEVEVVGPDPRRSPDEGAAAVAPQATPFSATATRSPAGSP